MIQKLRLKPFHSTKVMSATSSESRIKPEKESSLVKLTNKFGIKKQTMTLTQLRKESYLKEQPYKWQDASDQ